MADYYYNLKVIMCRERGDEKADGSLTYSEPTREEWVFAHVEEDAESEAAALLAFRNAVKNTGIDNAPQHISKIKKSGTGSLYAALSSGATLANETNVNTGKWHERIGKDVFRYEIGVSTSSASGATSRTAKKLR